MAEKNHIDSRIPQPVKTQANLLPTQPAPNYMITRPTKSIGIALVLALLFGPIGLFYASITGGIVMFFVCGIINLIGLLMLGIGLIITIPLSSILCAIWAYFSVSDYNEKLLNGQL